MTITSTEKIINDVLEDIRREENDVIEFGDKLPCYAKMKPRDKVELYHRLFSNRPDAERREKALKSYFKYPFINDNRDKYKCEYDFIYFNDEIKITADLLTGSKEIISRADEMKSECINEREIKKMDHALDSFCTVIYTIGNCCPVMKNKGGKKGTVGGLETCWYKLNGYIDVANEYRSMTELFKDKAMKDLRSRTADNMFMIFPQPMTGKEIVNNLLLIDFYKNDDSLIETRKPNEIETVCEYIDYLILCTKLIVQRGVRICLQYKDKEFTSESKQIIFEIFKQIGLPFDNKDGDGYLLTYEMGEEK